MRRAVARRRQAAGQGRGAAQWPATDSISRTAHSSRRRNEKDSSMESMHRLQRRWIARMLRRMRDVSAQLKLMPAEIARPIEHWTFAVISLHSVCASSSLSGSVQLRALPGEKAEARGRREAEQRSTGEGEG